MAKAPGLFRPDGRPVRQFGEDIIEPGEPFSGDTLSNIRALVSDETRSPKTTQSPSKRARRLTASRPTEPKISSERQRDPPEDPHSVVPANDITITLPDINAYAEDHLRTMRAMQEAAAVRLPPVDQSQDGAMARHPLQMPSVRESWRRLVIIEGALGRSLRSTLGRPRFWAMAFLLGLIALRPWVIPFTVLTLALTTILFVLLAGADRVASLAGWGYSRLKKHDPARAERLLKRGSRFLTKVEWLADRVPPSWVEGFHIPDLEAATAPPTDDAYLKSRLARIAAEEAGEPQLAKGT